MAYNPQIQVTPLPPSNNIERLQEIQRLTADPKESLTDPIKAAKLIKYYSPETLRAQAQKIAAARAPRGQAPVPTRPQMGVPASPPVAQPRRVFSEEGERILTAQGGGRAAIPQQIENVASKGRHGDTMLMHVNPQELRGLSSLLGPATINPDTGLPEAFGWWLPLIGAAMGGITTGNLKGAALGGLAGLGGAFMMPGAAASAIPVMATGTGVVIPGNMATIGHAMSGATAINPFVAAGGIPGAGGAITGAAAMPAMGSLAPWQQMMLGGTAQAPAVAGQALAPLAGQATQMQNILGAAKGLGPTIDPIYTIGGKQIAPELLQQSGLASWQAQPLKQPPNLLERGWNYLTGSGGDTAIQGGAKEDLLEATAKDTAKDTAKGAGFLPWWKSLNPVQQGLGVAGASSLAGLAARPKQTDFGFQLPIKKVSEFDLSKFETPEARKTKELTQEEIEERIFAGLPEEDRSYFEDATFAKKGGVIGRPAGGPLWTGSGVVGAKPPPSGFTYVPGMGPGGGPKLMTVEDAGGAYTQYGGVGAGPGFTPASQLPSSGGGAPASTSSEFPDVTPFRSGLSSFNVEDRLARILGSSAVPQQFTLPSTPTTFQTSPTLSAIPASVPSANLQQGPSAMESLFSRFQQAQGDPIIDLVSESVTPSQQGGLIGLYGGGQAGLGASGVSGGSFGLTGGSASGMAGSGPGAGGAGIGTGISKGPQTITVAPTVSRTGPIEGGEKTVTFTQPAPTPTVQSAPVTEGGKQLANTLNSIVSNVAQAKATLGPYGQMVSNMGILGMLGNMVFGEGSPMGLAGFSKALTNTGGYSPAIGPSLGTEDPYHVPNPILEEGPMATGSSSFISQGGPVGLALGGEPVFAGHLQGRGDGMSDQIPFRVVPQTPQDIPNAPDMAVLSTDEYVFPADAVSMLGNGSSNAGAKLLDDAVKKVRQASIGTPKQIKEIDGQRVLGGALTT